GIRDKLVTGVQTCALPILPSAMTVPATTPGSAGCCCSALAAGVTPARNSSWRREHVRGCIAYLHKRGSLGGRRVVCRRRDLTHRSEERRVGKEGSARGVQE